MGTEYTLRCENAVDTQWLDRRLRGLESFAAYDPTYGDYAFRSSATTGPMPDLSVRIEPDGSLYVCDNGGGSVVASVVGAIILALTRETDAGVTLRLLE